MISDNISNKIDILMVGTQAILSSLQCNLLVNLNYISFISHITYGILLGSNIYKYIENYMYAIGYNS